MQHRVPIIGRKGYVASLTWYGYANQPYHIEVDVARPRQKRFVLWSIDGGLVYAPWNKGEAWIRSRLLALQIVPFNPKSDFKVELKADTESYENGMRAIRDSLKSVMLEAHTKAAIKSVRDQVTGDGMPDVKSAIGDIAALGERVTAKSAKQSFATLSDVIRNDLEQRYGGRSLNEVILDDVKSGKAEVTIQSDVATHRTLDVRLRDGTILHIPGKPLPGKEWLDFQRENLSTLAQEAGLGWTPIGDEADLFDRKAAPEVKPAINHITEEDVKLFKFLNDYSGEFNSLDRYQEISSGSAIYPGQGTPFGLMYAALGLAEAGEVQNKVKKAFRDDGAITFDSPDGKGTYAHFAPITPERREQIIKELGGALWYIGAVCNEIDATMSEVAHANLAELLGRTERGTLSGSGDNR